MMKISPIAGSFPLLQRLQQPRRLLLVVFVVLCTSSTTTLAFVTTKSNTPRLAPCTTTTTTPTSLAGFLDDLKGLPSLFNKNDNNNNNVIPPKYDTVVIDPDFRVAALFFATGIILDAIPYLQLTLGPIVTLLGALFWFQTMRIRFIFDADNQLELVTTATTTTTNDDTLVSSGENVIVGGANRWACDTIVNYEFYPNGWMEGIFGQPILVYFKETQTPQESWNEGPGKAANDPEKIAAGTGACVFLFLRCVCALCVSRRVCVIMCTVYIVVCTLVSSLTPHNILFFLLGMNSRGGPGAFLSSRLQRQTN